MESSNSESKSFFRRHEFLIRRLHSLSGLIPVGVFLIFHLLTNSTVAISAEFFQVNVDRIHESLGPLLPIAEWVGIFIPILFHGIVGLWIVQEGHNNIGNYPYRNNWRYYLQRVTGVIAFVYIFYHVAHMHHLGTYLNPFFGGETIGGQFVPEAAPSTAAAAIQPIWVKAIYVVGMLSAVFHFANGIWTMGITWGLWITPAAQRRADYVAVAVGLLLGTAGLASVWGLSDDQLAKEGLEKMKQHHSAPASETAQQQENPELSHVN